MARNIRCDLRETSGITVRELPPGDEGRWDNFVRALPEGTFFHLSGWRGVIEKAFGHRTYYLQAERRGKITGVIPLTHIRSRIFGSRLISNAFCVYGGPIAADPDSFAALRDRATELMDVLGARYLEFRSLRQTCPDWQCRSDLYATFRKQISSSHELNMKEIPRKQRAMIRKGISNELKSVIDADTQRLHHVYAASVRNLGTPVFSGAYFQLLKRTFASECDVVTVLCGREAVASVMTFYFRDEALPYYGGGLEKARNLAANDFMYWEVMRRAVERGCVLFDFGRSKYGTGAYYFKRHWGFSPTPLSYEYKLVPGQALPNLNPLNPTYRKFGHLWSKLPLPVTKLIGPLVVRSLG